MQPHAPKTESSALQYARKCLTTMSERGVEPTPINYSVWYHYTMGDIAALNSEIDKFLKTRSLMITDDVNVYLYNKYIADSVRKEEIAVKNTSENTQNVLGEIMDIIEKFTGDTNAYNTQIDQHVNDLSRKITDPTLKEMAKEIINRAVSIRDSGSALQQKLEESKREVANLKTNLEKITTESVTDFLTGVGNRKSFEMKIEELAEWSKETKNDVCLLMVDIDYFKKFNDKYGHLIGDEVLKRVGRTLHDSVKGRDFVGRYGGEEFAVLLPNTQISAAVIVAENIRKNMHGTRLKRKDNNEFIDEITVSIGVARYRYDQDSIAMFISRADDALYRSKHGGRNKVTVESF